MRLFPYRAFAFETRLPPAEVTARLAAATGPVSWLPWGSGKGRTFEGKVTADGFEIAPVPGLGGRRGSVLISGRVVPTATGTRVEGELMVGLYGHVTMILFFSLLPLIGVLINLFTILQRGWQPECLLPFGMALFVWAFVHALFAVEAWWALGYLREAAAADEAAAPR